MSDDVTANTQGLMNIMRNPYVDIIGHPDDGRYPVDYEELVKMAVETNTLLELNNNSLNPDGPRKNTKENDTQMLKYCKKLGASIVIGSDAHIAESIGDFKRAESLIEEVGFPQELVVNSDVCLLKKYLHNKSSL